MSVVFDNQSHVTIQAVHLQVVLNDHFRSSFVAFQTVIIMATPQLPQVYGPHVRTSDVSSSGVVDVADVSRVVPSFVFPSSVSIS